LGIGKKNVTEIYQRKTDIMHDQGGKNDRPRGHTEKNGVKGGQWKNGELPEAGGKKLGGRGWFSNKSNTDIYGKDKRSNQKKKGWQVETVSNGGVKRWGTRITGESGEGNDGNLNGGSKGKKMLRALRWNSDRDRTLQWTDVRSKKKKKGVRNQWEVGGT